MPTKSGRLRRLFTLTAVAVLGMAAVPAGATAAPCVPGPTTQAFARFGDLAWYFPASGGTFEGGLTWARTGSAAVVGGNEPFLLAGLGHSKALRLPFGATVTTPKLCVTPEQPHLRFVAKVAGSGQLDVEVRFYGPDGKVTDSSSGGVSPSHHAAWAPSRTVDLKVGRLAAGQTGYMDVRFKSQGDWLLDDVLVDPLRRG